MLISKRRLQWLAITLLAVCLLLLLRPTRTWIDRWAIAWLLGPQVTVGELIIHSQHSLVEVRNLNWQAKENNRRFQLDASRVWLRYDQLGLIDRHPRLPKVRLQEANLVLSPTASRSSDSLEAWLQQLRCQEGQLDWEQITDQLDCLDATQALRQLWSVNIAQWTARSQQMLTQSEQLERQTERMDNPLRYEILLQEKFAALQQLVSAQASLIDQFDKLSEQIEAASARLRKLHDQDQIKIAGLVTSASAEVASDNDHTPLCQQLALGMGELFWQRTSHYGEVVDGLLRAAHNGQRSNYDISFRSNLHGNELLAVNDWRAAGKFSYGLLTMPYQASGNWLMTQESLQPPCLEYAWHASFYPERTQIAVCAQHASVQSDATQWLILQGPPDSATADEPGDTQLMLHHSKIELTSRGGEFHGLITLQVPSLCWLALEPNNLSPGASAAALKSLELEKLALKHADGDPLKFAIDGSWTQASLRLHGTIPAWLDQAVAATVEQRLQSALARNCLRLDQEFSNQLSELQKSVTDAVDHNRSLAAQHRKQLLATQERVQRQLADMNGDEFARRPGSHIR